MRFVNIYHLRLFFILNISYKHHSLAFNMNIHSFNEMELRELESLLNIDDNILYKWYLNKGTKNLVPVNNITKKLKKFKL